MKIDTKISNLFSRRGANVQFYIDVYKNNRKLVKYRREKRDILRRNNLSRQRYHLALEYLEKKGLPIDKV